MPNSYPYDEIFNLHRKTINVHRKHQMTQFYFLFFSTSFHKESNESDVDTNKNQNKTLIPKQPYIAVWRKTIYVPSWEFLSKTHVQTI